MQVEVVRNFIIKTGVLGVIFSLATTRIVAEPRQTCAPTVEELIAYALKNSPLVAEIDKDFASRVATALEIEKMQNPELQVERGFVASRNRGADEQQTVVAVEQPLRLSDFGNRAKVGDLIKRSADAQKQIKILENTLRIKLLYNILAAHQRALALFDSLQNPIVNLVNLFDLIRKRGQIKDADFYMFEAERFKIQAMVENLAYKTKMIQFELVATTGYKCNIHAESDQEITSGPELDVILEKLARNSLSEISRAILAAELATAQSRLASLDSSPKFSPKLFYEEDSDGVQFFGVGVSIGLPIWSRNDSDRLKAKSEANRTQTLLRFVEKGGVVSQVKTLHGAISNLENEARVLTTQVIPALRKALQSLDETLRKGKGSPLQLWQTLKALSEAILQSVETQVQISLAKIQLAALIGEEI